METLETRMQREMNEALVEAGLQPAAPAQAQTPAAQPAPAQVPVTPVPPQPAPQAPAPPQQATVQPPPAPDETALLRHQLDTLRGKYNAEVPRLHAALRERDATIEELRQTLASRPPAASTTPAAGNGATSPAFQAAFDAVKDEWGDKAAESFATMARAVAQDLGTQLEQRVSQKVQPVEQSVQDLAVQRYHDAISVAAGADWMQVNDDPVFVGWLQSNLEPGTGQTLQQALNAAYKDGNVQGVAFFFNTFKELKARQATTPTAPQPGAPPNPHAQLTPEQQAMTTPTSRQVGAMQGQVDGASGRVYTQSELLRLYDDIAKGRYNHDPKVKRSLEMDLDRAQMEGRVVAG